MTNYTEFNVNNYVYVQLTEKGRKIHKADHDKFCSNMPYNPPVEDEEGWSKWQLHYLMSVFGSVMYPGFDVPFKTTIRFVKEGV